ncbi:homeobox-leucine zipper protein HDG2 [Arachis duranensis]|uniref:Homeobox-leucine zipper protein HDG2 n=1 Tax=Arachis duranensis TaxID=130453 RepID=A0A6P4BKL7_ARADU|nr:homeobox-leucine zipper protein HDG2 [Arachis duranensis]
MSNHSMMNNNSSGSDYFLRKILEIQDFEVDTDSHANMQQPPPGYGSDHPKKKRYQRHTPYQIQEMETFFKACPHPDEQQRIELGNVLGLDHLQIKFWFQNKRTQLKNQYERNENFALKNENEELRAENENYKEILNSIRCHGCGGPPPPPLTYDQMRQENNKLREQIEWMSTMMSNCVLQEPDNTSNPNITRPQNVPNIESSQQNNTNNMMPQTQSVPNQELGNMASPPQSNNIDILSPSMFNQGIIDSMRLTQQNNGIDMPQNVINHGIVKDMPSSQAHNNVINVTPPMSMLNQGIGDNIAVIPPSVLDQGNCSVPSSSQHNNEIYINLPLSSLNQDVGSYGAKSKDKAGETSSGSDPLIRSLPVSNKAMIEELAAASLEELKALVQAGEPMWVSGAHNSETINEQEYYRTFPGGIGPRLLGYKSESSRESRVINMNHVNLVEILNDVDLWSRVFCSIVSKAAGFQVLSTGQAGSYDGNLQVVSSEFQMPTPLVPAREYYFLRYCKKLQDGRWVVVDASLETSQPNATIPPTRRRPSGCLIQASPDGYSTKVTWVEHVEVDDRALMVNSMYKPLVESGLAFGARRWVAQLDRRCERIASAVQTTTILQPQEDQLSVTSVEGKKGLVKLAERMVMDFLSGVGASTVENWAIVTPSTNHSNIRIITRKVEDDPGRPSGIVIGAATCFHLAVPPNSFFDRVRTANARAEWDVLCTGGVAEEFAHIKNGRDPGNCITLFRIKSPDAKNNGMIIVQESSSDSTGSFVIYAPVDMNSINAVIGGRDPDELPILPSGMAILPDGGGGCLVTLAFQILIESDPTKKISICSVSTINQLVKVTVNNIKALFKTEEEPNERI